MTSCNEMARETYAYYTSKSMRAIATRSDDGSRNKTTLISPAMDGSFAARLDQDFFDDLQMPRQRETLKKPDSRSISRGRPFTATSRAPAIHECTVRPCSAAKLHASDTNLPLPEWHQRAD